MSLRPILVISALLATVFFNFLVNYLPLNGITTAAVSDSYPIYFVPAGYVFSIWGIIYLFLAGFAVYQILPSQREDKSLDKIGWLFVSSCVLNAVWLCFFHFKFQIVTEIVIIGFLVNLILIYIEIEKKGKLKNWREFVLFKLPFSIYLGWLCVATIANTTVFLYELGLRGSVTTQQTWSGVMVLIAAALGGYFAWIKKDYAIALVLVWALFGIWIRFFDIEVIKYPVFIGISVLIGLIVGRVFGDHEDQFFDFIHMKKPNIP